MVRIRVSVIHWILMSIWMKMPTLSTRSVRLRYAVVSWAICRMQRTPIFVQ